VKLVASTGKEFPHMHPSNGLTELMHISVRLIVYPEIATSHDHSMMIDRVTKHLGIKWSVAKADFDDMEYHYIWDFHDHEEPNLNSFNALPLGTKVKLTIK
jgi:hypothetical protein